MGTVRLGEVGGSRKQGAGSREDILSLGKPQGGKKQLYFGFLLTRFDPPPAKIQSKAVFFSLVASLSPRSGTIVRPLPGLRIYHAGSAVPRGLGGSAGGHGDWGVLQPPVLCHAEEL